MFYWDCKMVKVKAKYCGESKPYAARPIKVLKEVSRNMDNLGLETEQTYT